MTNYNLINYVITIVWFINGFYCKILNLVPRHQEIVGQILNAQYSREITIMIGVAEVLLAIWILSNLYSILNSYLQISLVVTMNIIELIYTENLLLFGKWNIVFAFCFCGIIYYKEFILNKTRDV